MTDDGRIKITFDHCGAFVKTVSENGKWFKHRFRYRNLTFGLGLAFEVGMRKFVVADISKMAASCLFFTRTKFQYFDGFELSKVGGTSKIYDQIA
jgi:hypothetical protein